MRYPSDLAKRVHSQLNAAEDSSPSLAILVNLFEILYFASLKSEETETISCRIAFLNRRDPDPMPPSRVTSDRWRHFPLGDDIPFTVRNLVKLSKAVDPWVSTIAVDATPDAELRIWGLIDQSVHYSTYVMKETDVGPEMPGLFQAVIQGIGDIAAYRRFTLLAALRQDTLVTTQRRVLQSGPVHGKLSSSIQTLQSRVAEKTGQQNYQIRDHWDNSLEDFWISTLCRILIGIQRYGHGGAVLIANDGTGLTPKYLLDYRRLTESMVRYGVLRVKESIYSDKISEEYLPQDADIPIDLYLNEGVAENELRDTNNEITGCIRFLSSLSRVDGLIWLHPDLSLRGFGVEITSKKEPENVFGARDSEGTKVRKIDMNHFGTRHRSMIRHCAADPESVGFVVSQDGEVRAITNVADKVVVWDNVRLHSILNDWRANN